MNVVIDNIPTELRNGREFWVPWRYQTKPGKSKPDKIPYRWNANGRASSTDPSTWTAFDNAMRCAAVRGYDGIGIVLSDADPYTAVDLDNCVDDAGTLTDAAKEIVEWFASYSEITPSGRGLRIIVRGKFAGKGRNACGTELYCRGRFVTITGNHLPSTPTTIAENQAAVDWLLAKLAPAKKHRAKSGTRPDQDALAARCWASIQQCPDAISGEGGHNATLRAACECYRFGLDNDHAADVLRRFNEEKTGSEQWTEDELQHKLDSASQLVAQAGETGSRIKSVADRKNPLELARGFIAESYHHPEHVKIISTGGESYEFNGSHYQVIEPAAQRQRLYAYAEPLEVSVKRGGGFEIEPFKPTSRDIDNITDALNAVTYRKAQSPAWLTGGESMADPAQLIVAQNGVFVLDNAKLVKVSNPTPRLFTTNALDYGLNQNAVPALGWFQFIEDIFEDDQQQIQLLQEWAGLLLTSDTSLQKMLLLIGPPRSGKGTVARVLARMIGVANVCAQTLAGLGTNFGLWPLVNKTLLIISDARLSGRTDQAIVTERLLSISGEDLLTIDRKNREAVTLKLNTRIMLLTNELPKLVDASGALSNRFLILSLRKSYLGAEDTTLTNRLLDELPGIAYWALEGLTRLQDEKRFTVPAASDAIRQELSDLASPVSAFLRDCCKVRPGLSVSVTNAFIAWQIWCGEQGRREHGTAATFGRDLRSAVPGLGMRQLRSGDARHREYEGVGVSLATQAAVDAEVARRQSDQDRRERAYV
ncbi:MAG: phage/plasmid primase, P4 family [Tepidisphaeraceae bacterium]